MTLATLCSHLRVLELTRWAAFNRALIWLRLLRASNELFLAATYAIGIDGLSLTPAPDYRTARSREILIKRRMEHCSRKR